MSSKYIPETLILGELNFDDSIETFSDDEYTYSIIRTKKNTKGKDKIKYEYFNAYLQTEKNKKKAYFFGDFAYSDYSYSETVLAQNNLFMRLKYMKTLLEYQHKFWLISQDVMFFLISLIVRAINKDIELNELVDLTIDYTNIMDEHFKDFEWFDMIDDENMKIPNYKIKENIKQYWNLVLRLQLPLINTTSDFGDIVKEINKISDDKKIKLSCGPFCVNEKCNILCIKTIYKLITENFFNDEEGEFDNVDNDVLEFAKNGKILDVSIGTGSVYV